MGLEGAHVVSSCLDTGVLSPVMIIRPKFEFAFLFRLVQRFCGLQQLMFAPGIRVSKVIIVFGGRKQVLL